MNPEFGLTDCSPQYEADPGQAGRPVLRHLAPAAAGPGTNVAGIVPMPWQKITAAVIGVPSASTVSVRVASSKWVVSGVRSASAEAAAGRRWRRRPESRRRGGCGAAMRIRGWGVALSWGWHWL